MPEAPSLAPSSMVDSFNLIHHGRFGGKPMEMREKLRPTCVFTNILYEFEHRRGDLTPYVSLRYHAI